MLDKTKAKIFLDCVCISTPRLFNTNTNTCTQFVRIFIRTSLHVYVNRYGISVSQMTTFVLTKIRYFPHAWHTTVFVAKVTRLVLLMEQELPTLPEHLSSSQVFSGVHVARDLAFCIMLCMPLYLRPLFTPLVYSNFLLTRKLSS